MEQPSGSRREGQGTGARVRQFLTFKVAQEEYGVDILKVQEIRGQTAITPIPRAPPHVRGVMNLRGTVVPVVDVRERFKLERADYGKFSVIILVTVGSKVVGLVVDAVADVLSIQEKDIEPPPALGDQVDMQFIAGMAKSGECLITLLDIDKVFGLSSSQLDVTTGSLP